MTVVALPSRFTIGGSDAAAAAGIDPHRSRVMLWLEKTGRIERPETEAMRWGKLLEPVVFAELHEAALEPQPFTLVAGDRKRPWCIGHPDGLVTLDEATAVLEVKTAGQWAKREWHEADAPLHYVAQVQHYLHLTGLDRALLAILVGGQRLELVQVERDDDAIRRLLALEEDFYGYLVRDEPPPPDGSSSARDAMAALFPSAVAGKAVRLDAEAVADYRELKARKEQRDAIERQIAALENRLKLVMGEAEVALSPHDEELIRWRNVPTTRTDVKALRARHPEIAAEFVTTSETRRFQAL
jgi:putative phage-type endonuclease